MGIAMTLKDYLAQSDFSFEVIPHAKSHNSIQSAKLANVPADCVAKSVILEDDDGYLMAIVPCSHHVKLGALSRELHRKLRLASELELYDLFKDCELGAIPPLGSVYGIQTVVDEALMEKPEVYFEAGDHEELIHVDGQAFRAMMAGAARGRFSQRISGRVGAMSNKEPLFDPGFEF